MTQWGISFFDVTANSYFLASVSFVSRVVTSIVPDRQACRDNKLETVSRNSEMRLKAVLGKRAKVF